MNMHSWIILSQADARPLYLQIIDQIQRRVAVGDLPAGTQLPSIRQLAADLRVSVITVKRAYLELERLGVIATRHGIGSMIADSIGLQAAVQEEQLREHLRQAVGLAVLLKKSKSEIRRLVAEEFDTQRVATTLTETSG